MKKTKSNIPKLSLEELQEYQEDIEDEIIDCDRWLSESFPKPSSETQSEWDKKVVKYYEQKKMEKNDLNQILALIKEEIMKRGEQP